MNGDKLTALDLVEIHTALIAGKRGLEGLNIYSGQQKEQITLITKAITTFEHKYPELKYQPHG